MLFGNSAFLSAGRYFGSCILISRAFLLAGHSYQQGMLMVTSAFNLKDDRTAGPFKQNGPSGVSLLGKMVLRAVFWAKRTEWRHSFRENDPTGSVLANVSRLGALFWGICSEGHFFLRKMNWRRTFSAKFTNQSTLRDVPRPRLSLCWVLYPPGEISESVAAFHPY